MISGNIALTCHREGKTRALNQDQKNKFKKRNKTFNP